MHLIEFKMVNPDFQAIKLNLNGKFLLFIKKRNIWTKSKPHFTKCAS